MFSLLWIEHVPIFESFMIRVNNFGFQSFNIHIYHQLYSNLIHWRYCSLALNHGSYLHNGISYIGRLTYLYWIRALLSYLQYTPRNIHTVQAFLCPVSSLDTSISTELRWRNANTSFQFCIILGHCNSNGICPRGRLEPAYIIWSEFKPAWFHSFQEKPTEAIFQLSLSNASCSGHLYH